MEAGGAASAMVLLDVAVAASGLEEQVEGIVAAVDLARLQHGGGLVVQLLVLVVVGMAVGRVGGAAQRLVATNRAAWGQRLRDVCAGAGAGAGALVAICAVELEVGGWLLLLVGFGGAGALPAVAQLVVVFLFKVAAVVLPLAARGGEEALLALAAAAHTWRVVGIVDGPQVTAHLAATARDAGLVGAGVLLRGLLLLLRGRLRSAARW